MASIAALSGCVLRGSSPEPFALIDYFEFLVIDLARLLSGFCADLIDNDTFFDALFQAAELPIDNTSSSSKAKETNALLVLRTVANALQEGTSTSNCAWIEKVHFHSVRVTSWFLSTTSYLRSLEFSTEYRTKNSQEGNALHCQQYSLSKPPSFHRPRPIIGVSSTVSTLRWLWLIGSNSFSCMILQGGVDEDLRARHVRLISDVGSSIFPSPRCRWVT